MGVAATEEELALQQQQSQDNDTPAGGEEGDPQDGDPNDTQAGGDEEGDEVVVRIGDEEPPASEEAKAAPQWVKDLRDRQKLLAQENRELKARLSAEQPAQQAPTLPERPKLADFDFDEEAHQVAMDGWYEAKRAVEAHESDQQAKAEERQKAVRAVHEGYVKSKAALKVPDFQDAEDEVLATMDQVQQSIVIAGAANPGAMVYALGKNPAKLKELASIKDPVKFAVAVGKLETEVKVTKRTSTKPPPESAVRSGSGSAPATTATLERLEAEAAKTGDRSKVVAYKRQQRQSGK